MIPRIEGHFIWLPIELTESPAWKVLPGPAAKVLLLITQRWVQNNFKGNGSINLTYRAVMREAGISSKRGVSLAFRQLCAIGAIVMANGEFNSRKANGFRMTWLPGHNGGPATKEYLEIQSIEEAKRRLDAVTPRKRKVRVIVEFDDP